MSDADHKDSRANLVGQFLALIPTPLFVILVVMVVLASTAMVIAVSLGWTIKLGRLGEFSMSWTTKADGFVNSPTSMFQLEQRKFLVEMMLRDDPELEQDLTTIYDCFSEWPSKGLESSIVSSDDANRIIGDKNQKIFKAIKHHLNHLEAVSVAYTQGAVDPAAFETSYRNMIQMWYRRYKAGLTIFESHCGCKWEPFAKLGHHWEDDKPATPAASRYGDSCKAIFAKS